MDEQEWRYAHAVAAEDQIDAALREAEGRADAGVAHLPGHALHCAPSCPPDSCAVDMLRLDDRAYARKPYGSETGVLTLVAADAARGRRCALCGVLPGRLHHTHCVFEACPVCHDSLTIRCRGMHAAARGANATGTMRYIVAAIAHGPVARCAMRVWLACRQDRDGPVAGVSPLARSMYRGPG